MAAVVVENGARREIPRGVTVVGWPGRGALLVPGRRRSPASHQLTKSRGQAVTIRWSVQNIGDQAGSANLSLAVVGVGVVATSPVMTVSPGLRVVLSVTWAVNLPDGSHSANVVMEQPNAPSIGAPHIFTITVPTVAPPPPPPPPPGGGGPPAPTTGPILVSGTDLLIT